MSDDLTDPAYVAVDPEHFDPSLLPRSVLSAVEADSFWCLSRLLDGIQDNYIFAQPGIQRSVKRMQDLVARIDGSSLSLFTSYINEMTNKSILIVPLAAHLASENVEFMQFAFRWMNCLLMREISVRNTIRMWDTYLVSFRMSVCPSMPNELRIRRPKDPTPFLNFISTCAQRS